MLLLAAKEYHGGLTLWSPFTVHSPFGQRCRFDAGIQVIIGFLPGHVVHLQNVMELNHSFDVHPSTT